MAPLRIIGDVHGQVDSENLFTRNARPYCDLIAEVPYSIQIGDMGNGRIYALLIANVDASKHRFFPGNHDQYDCLPPHSLGDFGAVTWGGVDFFFLRGAASIDRDKLVSLGKKLGKTLWFEQEQLTDEQMEVAEKEYLRARPTIVLSHDAPAEIAKYAWEHARRQGPPIPDPTFRPSRTNQFLTRLLEKHAPRLWVFGHHHRDWRYREGETQFVCVGELSHIDIDSTTTVRST